MEIKNKHLAALVTAKKELRASLGLYNPGDPCRVEIERHLTNLEELQSGLKALRRQQLGYNGTAAGDPVQMIRVGYKVRVLCAVSVQSADGFVYHTPGSILEVLSSSDALGWNLVDDQGNVFHDVPAQYLSPNG